MLKIKEGYLLREVAGNFIVVAIGQEAVNFNGMITVNETGADLWKMLSEGVEDENALLEGLKTEYEYEIDDEDAVKKDIAEFVEKLKKENLLV